MVGSFRIGRFGNGWGFFFWEEQWVFRDRYNPRFDKMNCKEDLKYFQRVEWI